MSHDLHPFMNAFRGGRLVIVFLFGLFLAVMLIGFVAEGLRPSIGSQPTQTPAGGRDESRFVVLRH